MRLPCIFFGFSAIDLREPGSAENTIDLLIGDLFYLTSNPQENTRIETYKASELEYVKRLTKKEARVVKRELDDAEDHIDNSEDSGSDEGFRTDGGQFTETDEDPSDETHV